MADQGDEIVKNCPVCKKSMSRARRYYRNGKYYCTKNCWKSTRPKSTAKPEEAGG